MNEHTDQSRLTVLMFTDVVGSVGKKAQLGTAAYSELITRHDALFRSIVSSVRGAQVLQDTGDGFVAEFSTPSDGVNAALRFQQTLHGVEWGEGTLKVRVGLHLGQVTEVREPESGTLKYVGLATDLAARLMSLAQGGQILLSRAIFDDARQYVREHPVISADAQIPLLRWIAHGSYRFKGGTDPIEVFEVGCSGIAPLSTPPDNEKAKRAVSAEEEELLGWRPAAGLEVPRRRGWILEQKIGEGGFGEVWLGRHHRTHDPRVFKFCFDPDRLRSFKREMTLFRIMREALGDRKDIARLFEVQLEAPPYFLESEFSVHGNLFDWSEKLGGISTVPLSTRLDLVIRVAEAVAAAHSVGVLHKDIKPSNILIYLNEDLQPMPQLADFGIGIIADRAHLQQQHLTITGMTEEMLGANSSSRSGTRLYAPPESLTGAPFTVQGDVYALGILLYQMVVGDLRRPLATGWQQQIHDPLLVEDITACVTGDLTQRLQSAHELAERLRNLSKRRLARRRRTLMRAWSLVGGAAAVLAIIAVVWASREQNLRQQAVTAMHAADEARNEAVEQSKRAQALSTGIRQTAADFILEYAKQIQKLEGSTAARSILLKSAVAFMDKLSELDPDNPELQRDIARSLLRLGDVQGGARSSNVGDADEAMVLYQRALETYERLLAATPDDPKLLQSIAVCHVNIGDIYSRTNEVKLSTEHIESAIASAQKALQSPAIDEKTKDATRRVLNTALVKQSDKIFATGDMNRAMDVLSRSLEFRRAAVAAAPDDVKALRDLSVGLLREGEIYKLTDRYEESKVPLTEGLKIREKLATLPDAGPRERRDIAVAQIELADAYNRIGVERAMNSDPTAEQSFLEALALIQPSVTTLHELAVADPADARLVLDISKSELALTDVLASLKRHDEAEKTCRGIIARLDPAKLDPEQFRQNAGMVYYKLGEILRDTGRPDEARDAFEKAKKIWSELLEVDPTNARGDFWMKNIERQLEKLKDSK